MTDFIVLLANISLHGDGTVFRRFTDARGIPRRSCGGMTINGRAAVLVFSRYLVGSFRCYGWSGLRRVGIAGSIFEGQGF